MRDEDLTRSQISVVVPVYNSGSTLSLLRQRVGEALDDASLDYELVLVNDGSADDSWERIAEAVHADSRVRGIDLARNYGQHNALLAGIRAARGATVVTIDDDLQNPPEEIPKLLTKLDEGRDRERCCGARQRVSRIPRQRAGRLRGLPRSLHLDR